MTCSSQVAQIELTLSIQRWRSRPPTAKMAPYATYSCLMINHRRKRVLLKRLKRTDKKLSSMLTPLVREAISKMENSLDYWAGLLSLLPSSGCNSTALTSQVKKRIDIRALGYRRWPSRIQMMQAKDKMNKNWCGVPSMPVMIRTRRLRRLRRSWKRRMSNFQAHLPRWWWSHFRHRTCTCYHRPMPSFQDLWKEALTRMWISVTLLPSPQHRSTRWRAHIGQ